jgi:hypothetical protein
MTEMLDAAAVLKLVTELADPPGRSSTDHRAKPLATILAILLEVRESQPEHLHFQPVPVPYVRDDVHLPGRNAMMAYISEFGLLETLDCLATAPDLLNCTMEDAAEKLSSIRRAIQLGSTCDLHSRPC